MVKKKSLAALSEDQALISNTHLAEDHCLRLHSRIDNVFCWPLWVSGTHVAHRYTYRIGFHACEKICMKYMYIIYLWKPD